MSLTKQGDIPRISDLAAAPLDLPTARDSGLKKEQRTLSSRLTLSPAGWDLLSFYFH